MNNNYCHQTKHCPPLHDTKPVVKGELGAGNNGGAAGSSNSNRVVSSSPSPSNYHRRTTSTPSPDRRVIFPSLHKNNGASRSTFSQPKTTHHVAAPSSQHIKEDNITPSEDIISPKNVIANIHDALLKPLWRSNSLGSDSKLTPIPNLVVAEEGKTLEDGEFASSRPLNLARRTRAPSPVHSNATNNSIPPSSTPPLAIGEKHWGGLRSRSLSCGPYEETSSKSPIFGDAVRHRTYYPAASIPKPLKNKETKPSAHVRPLPSILRRKAPLPIVGAASQQSSQKSDELSDSSRSSRVSEVAAPQSSLAPITLASPASIKSLRGNKPRYNEGEGKDNSGIGESAYDIEHLSVFPKIIPRTQQKLPRPVSNTIVSKSDEEASSHGSCVSRHASLECLPSNRRISFDPHVTVYEFGTTHYERKGGEKWFSEDEMTQFKKEAMQRIRLRSMKTLIPTGTGRALVVASKENAKLNDNKSQGVISFNHPALGFEEDFDPNSRSPRNVSVRAAFQNVAAADHIKNILVVDSHEIFLALFTKSLKHMVPHASVATARSAEEALTRIEAARKAFPQRDGGSTHGFDIIVVEERLSGPSSVRQRACGLRTNAAQLHSSSTSSTQTGGEASVQQRRSDDVTSGSDLIRHLVELERIEGRGNSIRPSLMIGVSARLAQDREKIEKSGADCVWGKPPPEMNSSLRNELLKLLMKKRISK